MTTASLPAVRSPLAAVAALCRVSFRDFVKVFWKCLPGVGPLRWNWHLDLLCDEMQAVIERVFAGLPREYDLVVNVPFGTTKSSVISILLQGWAWARRPDLRFLCGTHTDSLAADLAARAKDVVESPLYQECFPRVRIRPDRSAREDYLTTDGGGRKSCTVGGKTPTGRHVHVILVDDPIDPQGVRSEAELETAAKFMTEIIPGRVVDKEVCPTILVMQRLHPRDPTAVMLEVSRRDGAVPVRHLCLPGELTGKVSPPLEWLRGKYGGRVYGEDGLLDPVRLPRRVLARYRATLGLTGYSCQIMQDPQPPGGAMFKPQWFAQRARAAPYHAKRVRYWDRAATSEDKAGCFTVGVLMARDDQGRYYVEHVERGQWEPNERNDRIVATAVADRTRYGPKNEPVVVVEAERGSTGLESFQTIARRLAGFRVKEDQPTGSKDVRAEPWADMLASLNVWFVEGGWDLTAYVQEHELFRQEPGKRLGKWKDQVDASSGAFNWLTSLERPTGQFRVLRSKGQKGPRLVVCSTDVLRGLHAEQPAVLIRFADPEPYNNPADSLAERGEASAESEVGHAGPAVMGREGSEVPLPVTQPPYGRENNGEPAGCGAAGDPPPGKPTRPHESPAGPRPHGLEKLLEELTVECADLAPAEAQETWDSPVPGYGRPAADLVLSRDQGRRLWGLLTRRRPRQPELLVFVDGGDRRALSAALAVCDVLRLPRAAVYLPAEPDRVIGDKEAAANAHVYDQVKATRALVL